MALDGSSGMPDVTSMLLVVVFWHDRPYVGTCQATTRPVASEGGVTMRSHEVRAGQQLAARAALRIVVSKIEDL